MLPPSIWCVNFKDILLKLSVAGSPNYGENVFGAPGTISTDLETGLQAGITKYAEFHGCKLRTSAWAKPIGNKG